MQHVSRIDPLFDIKERNRQSVHREHLRDLVNRVHKLVAPYLLEGKSLRGICGKNSFDQVFCGVTNSDVWKKVPVGPNVLIGFLNSVAFKRRFPVKQSVHNDS